MSLVSGVSAQPQQAYSNKVLEGEAAVPGGDTAFTAASARAEGMFFVTR